RHPGCGLLARDTILRTALSESRAGPVAPRVRARGEFHQRGRFHAGRRFPVVERRGRTAQRSVDPAAGRKGIIARPMDFFLKSLGTPAGGCFAVAGFLATAWVIGQPILERASPRTFAQTLLALILGIDILVLAALPLSFTPLPQSFFVKLLFAA